MGRHRASTLRRSTEAPHLSRDGIGLFQGFSLGDFGETALIHEHQLAVVSGTSRSPRLRGSACQPRRGDPGGARHRIFEPRSSLRQGRDFVCRGSGSRPPSAPSQMPCAPCRRRGPARPIPTGDERPMGSCCSWAVAYSLLQRPIVGRTSALAAALGSDRKGKLSLALYGASVPVAFFRRSRIPGPLPRRLARCICRVDPGSFTPSPSQIRT